MLHVLKVISSVGLIQVGFGPSSLSKLNCDVLS